MPATLIPPWLNINPVEPASLFLQGVSQGERAGIAEREMQGREQYDVFRNELARQSAITRSATAAAQIAKATADSLVKKASLERASQLAADKYEGFKGYQGDVANGMPELEAAAKWANKLFAGSPAAQVSAIGRWQTSKDTQAKIEAQSKQAADKIQAELDKATKINEGRYAQRDDAEFGKAIEQIDKWLNDPLNVRMPEKQRKDLVEQRAQKIRDREKKRQETLNPPKEQSTAEPMAAMPKVGEVRRGYKFLGGDPANPDSWQKQ